MAKSKKKQSLWESIGLTAKRFDEENPVVATRYVVSEGYMQSNEYDYSKEWVTVGTWHFDTEAEREAFLVDHEPDPFHEFRMRTEYKRHYHPRPYMQWGPV